MNDNKHHFENALNKTSQLIFRLLFYTKKSEPFSYAKDYSYNLVFEDLCNELTTTNETIFFLERLDVLLSNNVELEEYFTDRLDKIGECVFDEITQEDILSEINTHGSGALSAQSRWLTKRFNQLNELKEKVAQYKKNLLKLENPVSNVKNDDVTNNEQITPYYRGNSSNVDSEINIDKNVQSQDNNESFAEKFLFFLKGKSLTNKPYMTLNEYNHLIEATNYLFEKLEVPEDLKPIKSTALRAGEIRYSFYLMTKEKYPDTVYSENIFIFLTRIFPRLNDNKKNYRKSTNYKKFSEEPKNYQLLLSRNK
ncbi:hypothetical protein GCM10011514_00910 [Emticicia aquatilis]|uniref:Uncharacterized protein n=1 Tax=Emticicia aquatilis TaxID=1537369 RepID=A0A916YD94_9BACT|nr:hypothetical protein [Emticicia aquatilis]GGD40651.1 hypothetical protein GCM10011514_00910 [Emticicia aquatilis]